MRAVFDTSSLISLAWAGQLSLLPALPVSPLVLVSVYDEAVTKARERGYADAVAIEEALRDVRRSPDPEGATVDEKVVSAAMAVGVVAANDQALGRRAVNRGARWLRTVDLVLLAHRTGRLGATDCRTAVAALHSAGRIGVSLRDEYLEALR